MARATSVVVRPAASRARRTRRPSTTTSGLAPTNPWRTAKSLSTSGPRSTSAPGPRSRSLMAILLLVAPRLAGGPLGPAAGRLGGDPLPPPDLGEGHALHLVVVQRPAVGRAGDL